MSGSMLYFVIGIVVIVLVAVILIVWSIRQIRRGETPREASKRQTLSSLDADGIADGPAQNNSSSVREEPLSYPHEHAEQRDAREVLRALRASQEDARERLDVVHEDIEQASPMILLQQDVDASFAALSEDHVLGLSVLSQASESALVGDESTHRENEPARSVSEMIEEPPLPAIDLRAYLAERLAHPSVLGFMIIDEKGTISASDQTYDPELSELFGTLVADAKRTADTVGLASQQEVIVRGEEGLIYLLPLAQLEVAQRPLVEDERFLVVFLDPQEGSLDDVTRGFLRSDATDERVAKHAL